MKNNPLDDIVKCDIDLSDPVSNEQSFGSLCLIVPPPADASAKGLKKATLIYKASELLDYGFTVEDVAYRAAQVACSYRAVYVREGNRGAGETVGWLRSWRSYG